MGNKENFLKLVDFSHNPHILFLEMIRRKENKKANFVIMQSKRKNKNITQIKEVERKFLLSEMPLIEFDETIVMDQHYIQHEGDNIRIRLYTTLDEKTSELTSGYEVIRKEKVGGGENIEHKYNDMSIEEARLLVAQNMCKEDSISIYKVRRVKHFNKNGVKYKVEIDTISGIDQLLMEIEVPHIKFEYDLPEEIEACIIKEVTGNIEYDNYTIAKNGK